MSSNSNQPERPRSEPEIIPPGQSGGPRYGYAQDYGTHRVYVTRMGPFGFALMMLVIGLFAAVMLLALIGAAFIWIPVVAVFVIAAAISGLWRRL
jgi:hypothetical protein